MTQALFEKKFGGLYPADEEAHRVLGRIKTGTHLVLDIKDPSRRSTQQHNFWFAMLGTMFEREAVQAYAGTFENFRKLVLIRLGHCDSFKRPDGAVDHIAHSVAWGKMTSEEFSGLVDQTLDLAVTMGFDRDELLRYTRERMGNAA